jgi:hypothetical protein
MNSLHGCIHIFSPVSAGLMVRAYRCSRKEIVGAGTEILAKPRSIPKLGFGPSGVCHAYFADLVVSHRRQ